MPVSSELAGVPMVDVWRGERVESTHAVATCACDDAGTILLEHGTIDVPVFLRSAAKPFIAAAAVRAGVVERFGLDAHEVAVMSASHMGEPRHLATAAAILAKIGASGDDLQCGGTPDALHNNCSGKHAGILALARLRGEPFAGYLDATHPVQREILGFCERVFDDRFTPDRLAVDGCGIPVFATTLARAARGFARFATLRGLDDADRHALLSVRDAMTGDPWMVSGSDRFDTDLMTAACGTIVAKGGAEGVHATALLPGGRGLVLKVIDGAARAVAPAALALLAQLGALEGAAVAPLARHARPPVRNVAGRVVGEIRARATGEKQP
jgi:L-asparaginase II